MSPRVGAAAAVVTAALSSACCWLPLLVLAAGIGSAGAAAVLEPLRPWLLGASSLFLALGFWLAYRPLPAEACGPAGCPPPSRRGSRSLLWLSATGVLLLAAFPNYVAALGGDQGSEPARGNVLQLGIEGMTCAGCEATVEAALSPLPGVAAVRVSYAGSSATLLLEEGLARASWPDGAAIRAALAPTGYRLVSLEEVAAQDAPAFEGRWVGQLLVAEGTRERVTLDLDRRDGRWVGHFSVANTPLDAYPLVVSPAGAAQLELLFTGFESRTRARLAEGGDLLVVDFASPAGATPDTVQLRRQGPPQLDPDFVAMLEAGPGQLQLLDPSGELLRERFDADHDKARLLVMLSPT